MDNFTSVTMLTLSGFNDTVKYRAILFFVTLLCYCAILLINGALVLIIIVEKALHEPMYIFLCNLCINTLYGTAGFYPRFLVDLLSPFHVISYSGCMLQGFIIHSSACGDFSILALMAYDRYVAICRPLVYHSTMSKLKISLLIFFSWLLPFCLMSMSTITLFRANLCGSHIPKIYCTNFLIGRLACSISKAYRIIPYFNISFYLGHVLFIVWSYMYLIRICSRTKENRGKFMQTCMPHLISLVNVVVSLLLDLMYTRFGSKYLNSSVQNFMGIEFLLIPPIVNPLIYGFKLTKIRNRVRSLFSHKRRKSLN